MKIITKYITITKELALRSKTWDCEQCPVALAIKEQLGYTVKVGSSEMYMEGRTRVYQAKHPKPLADAIQKFDNSGRIAYRKYRVHIPA